MEIQKIYLMVLLKLHILKILHAAISNQEKFMESIYPVIHSEFGMTIIKDFVYSISQCKTIGLLKH